MIKLLHTLIYGLLWSAITLKNVLAQLWTIFRSEFLSLFGKPPTAQTIRAATKSLKKYNHLGLILDFTHFGPNGMLVGSSLAQLVAMAQAADSSHISVFLPRKLTDSEQDRLKALIAKAADQLNSTTKLPLPTPKYYDSIYTTLTKQGNDAVWASHLTTMAKERKHQLSGPTSVASTSWGISGSHLLRLTDFETAFKSTLAKRFNAPMDAANESASASSNFDAGALQVTFISPLDGKPAIARAAQIIQRAIETKALEEADVDQSIVHALLNSPEGQLWPSPDLIINFTDVPSTCGYPVWQLRYAEIVNAGSLATENSAIWEQFHGALRSFSKTVQRFGK